MRKLALAWMTMVAIAGAGTLGCGTEPTPGPASGGSDTAQGGSDTAAGQDTGGGAKDTATGPSVETLPLQVAISVLVNNEPQKATVLGSFVRPLTCTQNAPCPLAIVVGDRDSDAFAYEASAEKMAAAIGVNVVVFNLPGQGVGAKKSSGVDDIGGIWHETAVKEVTHLMKTRAHVDKTKVGFIAIGTGLIPVASAIKVYGTSALKDVLFLLDVEGPTDRCAISQAPEDAAKGIGPGDGPGATDSACNFGKAPHSAMYPAAKDGNPASIVCAEGAWPITKTGQTCADNSWWASREPATTLKKITQKYQRLQFKYDHRLPSYWSSRVAIASVASSGSKYFALNDMPACGSPFTDADCVAIESGGQSCWLQGDYGNGMAPAPYAGGKLQPVSIDELFTQVLPGYVTRLLNDPLCK